MAHIDMDGLILDDETGEIVEAAEGQDSLAIVARRRHEAHTQAEQWKRVQAIYDAVLLRQQEERTATYGDVLIRIAGSSYSKFDAPAFREEIAQTELTPAEWEAIALAASNFDPEALPPIARTIYGQYNQRLSKRPWIMSQAVLRRAPEV